MQFRLTDDFEIILLTSLVIAALVILIVISFMVISFWAVVWLLKELARGNKTFAYASNNKMVRTSVYNRI